MAFDAWMMFSMYIGKRSRSGSDVTHKLKLWKVKFSLNSCLPEEVSYDCSLFLGTSKFLLNTFGQCCVCFCSQQCMQSHSFDFPLQMMDLSEVDHSLKSPLILNQIWKGQDFFLITALIHDLENWKTGLVYQLFSKYCANEKVYTNTFVLKVCLSKERLCVWQPTGK